MRKSIVLYKAKRKDNGEWVYGYYIGDTGDYMKEVLNDKKI